MRTFGSRRRYCNSVAMFWFAWHQCSRSPSAYTLHSTFIDFNFNIFNDIVSLWAWDLNFSCSVWENWVVFDWLAVNWLLAWLVGTSRHEATLVTLMISSVITGEWQRVSRCNPVSELSLIIPLIVQCFEPCSLVAHDHSEDVLPFEFCLCWRINWRVRQTHEEELH